jgi:hypothetical protein
MTSANPIRKTASVVQGPRSVRMIWTKATAHRTVARRGNDAVTARLRRAEIGLIARFLEKARSALTVIAFSFLDSEFRWRAAT